MNRFHPTTDTSAKAATGRPLGAKLLPLAVALAAVLAGPMISTPALAQNTYSAWEPPVTQSDDLTSMVDALEKLIDQAEREKAADPEFLNDLNALLASYQNPWNTKLLFDDFSDGNFNRNPVWTVSTGTYDVKRNGANAGLLSKIVPQNVQEPGQDITIGNIIIGTLNNGASGAGGSAAIYTPVRISNAFRVEMSFTSKEKYGRWDFGPYQGRAGNVAYRVAYFPGEVPSLQLLRVTSQGETVIASYDKALQLENNQQHVLVWTRDRSGLMYVAIDGQQLLKVSDSGIRQPFDGFLMVNSGGTYSVRSIVINGRPTTPAS